MSSAFWKYFQKVLAWPLIRRPGPLQAIAGGTAHALDSVIDDVIYARKQFFPSLAEEDLVLEHGFGRGLQRKNGETPEKFRSRVIRAWHWHMLGGKTQGLPQILRYYGFDVTAIDNVRQWQPSRWSDFQVRLAQPVTQEEQTALLNSLDLLIWIINEYKPARSVLARVYTTTYNWEPSIWSETAWSYGFWSTFSGVPYDVQGMDGLVVSLGMQRGLQSCDAYGAAARVGLAIESSTGFLAPYVDRPIWSRSFWSDVYPQSHGFTFSSLLQLLMLRELPPFRIVVKGIARDEAVWSWPSDGGDTGGAIALHASGTWGDINSVYGLRPRAMSFTGTRWGDTWGADPEREELELLERYQETEGLTVNPVKPSSPVISGQSIIPVMPSAPVWVREWTGTWDSRPWLIPAAETAIRSEPK